MKVERIKVPQFQPVTLVLETLEDVKLIIGLLGGCSQNVEGHITGVPTLYAHTSSYIYNDLSSILEEHGASHGCVHVKEVEA